MKHSRRQDLKTNVLSIKLQEAYDTILRNSNYFIGGAVAVVVILVIALVVQRNRQATLDQAEKTYLEIQSGNVAEKPELIDQAGRLAEEQGLNTQIGVRAAELQGDLAYQLARNAGLNNRTEMISRFKQAKSIYGQLLAQKAGNPAEAARLRMSLAATEESLFVAGEGSPEAIRQLYKEVIDGQDVSFKAIAEDNLKTLDERLTKLRIVATQPASAPATGPSGAAGQMTPLPPPSIRRPETTAPAATMPVSVTRPPASKPAQ